MSDRYAIVSDGVVATIALWDGETSWEPEGGIAVPCGREVRPGWTWDGGSFAAGDAPAVPGERRRIAKSLVQDRLIAEGRMEAAYAALTSQPVFFARWFAPDHPDVYADDPDALALLTAIGADPAVIMA